MYRPHQSNTNSTIEHCDKTQTERSEHHHCDRTFIKQKTVKNCSVKKKQTSGDRERTNLSVWTDKGEISSVSGHTVVTEDQ